MANEWMIGHNQVHDQPWHRAVPGDTLRLGRPDPGPPPHRPHNMTSDQVPAQRWTCEYCGRKQASVSESCWSCGAPKRNRGTEPEHRIGHDFPQDSESQKLLGNMIDDQQRLIEHMARSTDRAVLKIMIIAASLATALMASQIVLR